VKIVEKGAWPRSRDLLFKFWEPPNISDFQHGYQMWIWFVNFSDQEKQKLISKTEHQFNTSV